MDNQASWKTFDLLNPTDEHQMLRETVRDFVKKEVEPQALESDRNETFNLALIRKLGELGLLGITVPEEFGGSGLDASAAVIAHDELAYSDPALTLSYLTHSMLCVNNFNVNADKELKTRILPKLCTGEWIGAMGMSEPDFGTDVLGMRTSAKLDGDHYVINGRKMWITNGTTDEKGTPADCVLLYARTGESNGRAQISTFMVEQTHPGYSVGQKISDKMGMRASPTAELVFENCKVPVKNRLGSEGESVIHMMRNLEIERLTLAAISVGLARRCIEVMVNYANERKAFGKPIREYGQIQRYIAESVAEYRACRTYLYDQARQTDLSKEGNRLESDAVKLACAPMGKRVADRAIQVLGGYGYVGEYHVERLYRDAKLIEIGGGTVEAHHKNIARDLTRDSSLLL